MFKCLRLNILLETQLEPTVAATAQTTPAFTKSVCLTVRVFAVISNRSRFPGWCLPHTHSSLPCGTGCNREAPEQVHNTASSPLVCLSLLDPPRGPSVFRPVLLSSVSATMIPEADDCPGRAQADILRPGEENCCTRFTETPVMFRPSTAKPTTSAVFGR